MSLREILGVDFNEPFVPSMDYIAKRNPTAKKPSSVWEIIHRGGYPEIQNPELNWNTFYSSYVQTYLEKDVRQLTAVQDLNTFRRFMVACAARTGQVLNYSNIAEEISKDEKTVRNWVSILETPGIVYLLEPYSSSVLNRAIKTPKLYFRDTGLAAYLTRWLTADTLANGAMRGAMFETWVISEILKSYSNAGIDYKYCVSYYRGKDRKLKKKKKQPDGTVKEIETETESEIDFIIEKDGILYPIEIKCAEKVTADGAAAFQILDKTPDKKRGTGAIICNCPQPGMLRDNLFAIPEWYI